MKTPSWGWHGGCGGTEGSGIWAHPGPKEREIPEEGGGKPPKM